jgi:methylphosphotriester-DNA--protein-cysteine methyltransferase
MSITGPILRGATIRFIEAAEVLRPFVGCFWIVEAERGATIRVVPDGSTAISLQLSSTGSSEWLLRGPLVRPDERRFTSAATLIGVRLRPGVAFLLTGISADRMIGRRLRLSGCESPASGAPEAAALTPAHRIDALQRFMIERLTNANVNVVVARAVDEIGLARGCARVGDVARACGVSPRHLNRLMRVWIGYGPKRLCLIVRFQSTLHQMADAPRSSGAALATDRGFFDQAHLTLDVARLAGATPRRLTSRHAADFHKTRCDSLL